MKYYVGLNSFGLHTAPGSKVLDYTYNALGQPTQYTHPNGMTTAYTYDTRNRMTKIEHKDGSTVKRSFEYALDDDGTITKTTHEDGSYWDYGYDGRNRLTSAVRNNKTSSTIKATYTYTYDAGDNMLTKVTPFEDDFNDGNYTGWTKGTGTASAAAGYVETTGYTSLYRSNSDADLEQWISYYVDPATTATGLYARVWARYSTGDENIAIYLKDTEMRIYQRDNAVGTFLATNTAADTNEGVWYEMRIVADGTNLKVYRGERGHAMEEVFNTTVAVTTTSSILMYAEANTVVRFDNNRLNSDSLSTTTTYAYNNANELTSMTDYNGATRFTYDDWGRTVTKSRGGKTATYAWRYGSKLQSVTTDWFDEEDVSYLYGGNGKRMERTAGGVTTGYNWDRGMDMVSEESTGGTLQRTYVNGVATLLAHANGTDPSSGTFLDYFPSTDSPLGTVYNGTTVVSTMSFTPFGESYSVTGTNQVSHGFAGSLVDRASQISFGGGVPIDLDSTHSLNGSFNKMGPGTPGGNGQPPKPPDPKECDYCGSKGTEWVPDNPAGFDFSQCCKAHDKCYGTCGSTQETCDLDFRTCMQDKCWDYFIDGRTGACMILAAGFYGAVVDFGKPASDAGQEKGCKGEECDEPCKE